MARLEEFLLDDDAMAYYLAVSQQEALLPSAIPASYLSPVERPGERGLPRFVWIAGSVAAACLVFFAGLGFGRRLEKPQGRTAGSPAPVVTPADMSPARITGMVGVEWRDEGGHPHIDLNAGSNEISIKSGLVEVTYSSGVLVTLEGPAVFRVDGYESATLESGKLYTTVPPGAEGFKVHYSGGTVEDLGTEFAMDIHPDGSTEVGVFLGKVKLHSSGRESIMLFENQSLVQSPDAAEPLQPVPLDRQKFVDRLPARDFRWEVNSPEAKEVSFDVTHLVWKPAKYRAIFKWINGPDAVVLKNVRLCCDSKVVASDDHPGSTGILRFVSDNIYTLDIGPEDYIRGNWTVVAEIGTMDREGGRLVESAPPFSSRGILQFEEGLVTEAGPSQFMGRWSYRHMGDSFTREFHPDGSVSLEKNGVSEKISWADSRWTVESGILKVTLPKKGLEERHVLRDLDTLIFSSNPYENAVKSSAD
ncbi:hypothetical protein GCM10023212_09300 [Luteolibacter yonseiensis]